MSSTTARPTRPRVRARSALGALLAITAGMAFASAAQANTFTVTNTNNGGVDSLRAAVKSAELTPAHDDIVFAIPGAGPHTITPVTALPVLTQPVTLDASTQAGWQPATGTAPAQLMVTINAGNVLRGIDIGGNDVEVRGLAINSAQDANVFVEGHKNVVAGNHIGTNRAGDAANQYLGCNVEIYGPSNRIGGPRNADRNVISGRGVELCVNGASTDIVNNRIGTTADGSSSLGFSRGIELRINADGSVVRDNLVSGLFVGMEILGDGNTIQGNRVGTNAEGTATITGGSGLGINVEGGDANTIGGAAPGQGNLISGNAYGGLQLESGDDPPLEEVGAAEGNLVVGNLIGTDTSGTLPLGNGVGWGESGVRIMHSNGNTVGGDEPGAANVIAANEGNGIWIAGDEAVDNVVLGNSIGTNLAGASGLGNGGSGVLVDADSNHIGDESGTAMNTITNNGEDGVTITETADSNAVVRNVIFANGTGVDDLGIDLAADGVTSNDADDLDAGGNQLLNHPLVDAADAQAGTVTWTLDGLSSTLYRLDFYASSTCDASGSGEGQRYLGTVNTVTDIKGHARDTTGTLIAPLAGEHITMTATRRVLVGPLPITPTLTDTSEFSPCVVAG